MRTVIGARGLAVLLGAAFCAGCPNNQPRSKMGGAPVKAGEQVGGFGVRLWEGKAIDLRVTNDGAVATFLADAEKPRLEGVPNLMRVGALYAVKTAPGATPRRLGTGVTNVAGGYLATPDSRWLLFLSGYNASNREGELLVADLTADSGDPVRLGGRVSFVVASPDSKQVAFIDDGRLKVGPIPSGPFRDISADVSQVEFAKASDGVVFKNRIDVGGAVSWLSLKDPKSVPWKMGTSVGHIDVSPAGRYVAFGQSSPETKNVYDLYLADVASRKVRKIADGAGVFGFSPDGRWLARTEGGKPEVYGDLFVGPADGTPGKKVGEKVNDFSFSPDSAAIAYLELYDLQARAGVLGFATVPDGTPKRIGDRCPGYTWGKDGTAVAFLSRFLKPVFSVDLMLYQPGWDKAHKVQQGVFGYSFTPDNAQLMYRTACTREGRSCDLYALDMKRPKEADAARKLVEGMFSYKFSDDGQRVLLSYARTVGDMYDVAVMDRTSTHRKTLEQWVGIPAHFSSPTGARAAYIVQAQAKQGVYVADAALE